MEPARVRRESKTRDPCEATIIAHGGKDTEPGGHIATGTIGLRPEST